MVTKHNACSVVAMRGERCSNCGGKLLWCYDHEEVFCKAECRTEDRRFDENGNNNEWIGPKRKHRS